MFLEQIGRNAAYIQHMRILFPTFGSFLEVMQSKCTQLTSITISLRQNTFMLQENPVALRLSDHFSSCKIIVEYSSDLDDDAKRALATHGWELK